MGHTYGVIFFVTGVGSKSNVTLLSNPGLVSPLKSSSISVNRCLDFDRDPTRKVALVIETIVNNSSDSSSCTSAKIYRRL